MWSPQSSGYPYSIITVPYVKCMDGDNDIMLADLVSTNGLLSNTSAADADQLIVLTTNDVGTLRYCYYWLQSGAGWIGIDSNVKHPDGSTSQFTPPVASEFSVARGKGFWLKRASGSTADVYVKGEVSISNPSTKIVNGLNLVGYGTAEAFELNRTSSPFNFTGVDGGDGNTANSDEIIVVGSDGSLSYYYYFDCPTTSNWTSLPNYDDYEALDGKWITEGYAVADVIIPAGKGFWYRRLDGGEFDFEPDGSNQ